MVRPVGPIQVKKTIQAAPNVRLAELGGAVRGRVAIVKKKDAFYFVGPEKGSAHEVPADSFTDALHWEIGRIAKKIKRRKGKK